MVLIDGVARLSSDQTPDAAPLESLLPASEGPLRRDVLELVRADTAGSVIGQAGERGGLTLVTVQPIANPNGQRWHLLVVRELLSGPRRFTELREALTGISPHTLTGRLRQFEKYGIVTRTAYPEIPPRVEYELTRLGETLLEPIRQLAEWAGDNRTSIQAAREKFDAVNAKKKQRA